MVTKQANKMIPSDMGCERYGGLREKMITKDMGLSEVFRKRPLQVITNIVTLWSFLFSIVGADLTWAANTSIEPTHVDFYRASGSGVVPLIFDINNASVPFRFGEIKDTFKGSNGKTIIHIQDAHCNYSAQHSTEAILRHLVTTYNNVGLVSLEGGRGNYDLSVFTKIKDPEIRKRVSDYFVKEGRISGPEFFAINNPGKIKLFGIEDEKLYSENLNAYRSSLAYKEEVDKYLNALSLAITNLKLKIYSSELKEVDNNIKAYKDGKIDFKIYIAFLKEKMGQHKIDIKTYINLSGLLVILNDEKSINFKSANSERNILIDRLSQKLSSKDLEDLAAKTIQFKQGDVTNEEFYGYLFRKARFAGVDFGKMPNLMKYSEYVNKYEAIDKIALYKEISKLESSLIENLAMTDDQKTLYSLDKDLSIIKGMFNIALVKEDFDYYLANRDGFSVKRFTDFINKKAPLCGLSFKLDERIIKLDSYRDNMEKFYIYSQKRDDAFIKNIENKLKSEKKDITVLVTGGFHTGNIAKLLKDKGYSYIEVMPKFEKTDIENPYFKILSGGKSHIETIVESRISNIAVPGILSEMGVTSTRDKNIYELSVDVMTALDADPKKGIVLMVPGGYLRLTYEPETGSFNEKVGEINGKVLYTVRETSETYDPNFENIVVFDRNKLSYEGHQAVWDLLLKMAHTPSETYAGLEAHSLSDFLKPGTELYNNMVAKIGEENVKKLLALSDKQFGDSARFIHIVTGKDKSAIPWRIASYSDGYGVNVTYAGDANKFIKHLLHELNRAANPGLEHEANVLALTQPSVAEMLATIEMRLVRSDFATGEMPSMGQMSRREFLIKAGLGALAFTFIGSLWGCGGVKAPTPAGSESEKATVSAYSGKYSVEEVTRDPVKAREFINDYLAGERKFFEIVHRRGIAVDGWNLNPETLEPESIREHTAASKESLDVSILVKALVEDVFAAQVVGNGNKVAARQKAIELLKEKIDSYQQFNRDFPVFGGFLPWIKVTDRVQPVSDWQDKVPALDNGEWVWSLYAAYHALDKIGEKSLSIRYKNYFDLLRENAPAIFYDKDLRKIRAETKIKNPDARTVNIDNYENNVAGYFLDDPYEGIMMAYFLTLFTDLPASEKSHIWDDIKMEKVKTSYGTTYKGWPPASPLDGSAHIKWPLMFLPITDNPIAMKVFGLQEKLRTNLNKYGTPASTNTPGRIGYTQYEANIFAPYGAFSMILYSALQGDVAKGNYGLAWLLNMLNVDKMVGPSGSGESFSVTPGTNVLDQISFINTCDGKMNIWLAMMGGVVPEIREGLEKDGAYDRFRQVVDKEYAETFGDLSSVIDNAEFHLPVKPIVGKYKPTQSKPTADMTDMRELWQYPMLDKWGDKAVGEIKDGSIYITYKSTDGGWGWVGGSLREDIVPNEGSAIYISGEGSFKLKLETASKGSVLIDVKLKGSDVWTKVPLDDAVGKTFSVMVIDQIMGDIIIKGMKYSPDGNAPSGASKGRADARRARGDFATGEMPTAPISIMPNSIGQKVLQVSGLLVANTGSNWSGWIDIMKQIDKQILDLCEKNIFEGAPAMVNIPISEEFADKVFAVYQSAATEDKARLSELVMTHRLGNITVNLFRDNVEGRQKLEAIIKSSGITKNQERIVTFAYQKEGDKRDVKLEATSYVVYMTGEVGKTVTPIGTCGMTGLEYLNRSDLMTRQEIDAEKINQSTERFVRGLAAIAGTNAYEALLDEIAKKDESGIRQLLATGLILVRIRPVDTQEIVEFHKREAEVLKSL